MSVLDQSKDQLNLDLFGFFGDVSAKDKSVFNPKIVHSNTIAIYDALPKYNWSSRQPKESSITRHCLLQGVEYEMTIEPALVERIDKKTKEKIEVRVYPGEREEAIEDVLRGFAANGQGKVFGQEIGVNFTLRQLREELESIGKTYNHDEILESLIVCNKASLKVRAKGRIIVNSALFPTIILTDRENYKADGATKCFVRFHPLVMASVINLDYRMFNYHLAMSIRDPLARHVYKRLAHYWRQASSSNFYEFKLMSYLSQTPRNISPRMPRNLDAMKKALDELLAKNVLKNYEVNEIYQGRKLLDADFKCVAHSQFVADIKKANFVASKRGLYATVPELLKNKLK